MTAVEIIGIILALLLMSVGLIGCIVPALPGTPLILAVAIGHRLYFGTAGVSNLVMTILVALTVLSLAFDFLAGLFGANKFGATWRGALGALLGGIVGLFFGLVGIFLGPFLGAMIFELLGDQKLKAAAKAGLGATIGLLAGIIGKFAIAIVMILLFATNVIVSS